MKAEIIELLGKSRSDLSVNFTDGVSKRFTGESAWKDFEQYYSENQKLFGSVSRLDVYSGFNDPTYITKFKNLHLLTIISRIALIFPNMENMTSLQRIHINQQSKASSFQNIWTAPNLSELYIGDFSVTKSVEISSLDEILKCKADADVEIVGQEWLLAQSKELKAAGVPVLHYYTLGKPNVIANVVKNL